MRRTLLACILAGLALTAGCQRGGPAPGPAADKDAKTPLKVAFLGLTCEAPIFVAQEKGFFAEEGLDAELVRTDWDGLREGLGLGRFDANHTLIMYLLKPIESGLDVKITAGIHTGCLRLQVGVKSEIKSARELKGKKIGVPTHIGSPPYLFASRILAANGIDPSPEKGEVTWLPFPPDVLGKAVEDGRVDAIATSDPIGTILVGKGVVRTIADQAKDEPYKDEYCCAAVVSGKLARENPAAAAKATRALLKAAKWTQANPVAAATLGVEKKYVASTVEMNALALSQLSYDPSVAKGKTSIAAAAVEMKQAGLLKSATDPAALAKRAWLDLDGVNDAWLTALTVERLEGDRDGPMSPAPFAALFEGRCLAGCNCCTVFADE